LSLNMPCSAYGAAATFVEGPGDGGAPKGEWGRSTLRAMSRDTATVRCAFRAPPPSADRKPCLKKIGHALTARASGTGGGKPRHHWSWNRAEHPFRPMVLAISSRRSGVRG